MKLIVQLYVFASVLTMAVSNGSYQHGQYKSTKEVLGCPPPENILPCACTIGVRNYTFLACQDSFDITQERIDTLFREMRLMNPGGSLGIFEFRLEGTNLVTLDLTPLTNNTYIRFIYIHNNEKLSTIISQDEAGLIVAEQLYWTENAFTDTGLLAIFKYFSPVPLLILSRNQLTASKDVGFITGLANYSTFRNLEVPENTISRIERGIFKTLGDFRSINLSGNPVEIIEDGAFEFNNSSLTKNIRLDNCTLTDEKISSNHGLDKSLSQVNLRLDANRLDTISSSKFEPFLRAPVRNTLNVTNNPLICDARVKWLKDDKEIFEPLVSGAMCINDPGFSVFNSSWVP